MIRKNGHSRAGNVSLIMFPPLEGEEKAEYRRSCLLPEKCRIAVVPAQSCHVNVLLLTEAMVAKKALHVNKMKN
jgi:hypothetical protein